MKLQDQVAIVTGAARGIGRGFGRCGGGRCGWRVLSPLLLLLLLLTCSALY